MPEWLNGTVSKTVYRLAGTRVRIPLFPQNKVIEVPRQLAGHFSFPISRQAAIPLFLTLLYHELNMLTHVLSLYVYQVYAFGQRGQIQFIRQTDIIRFISM
jgi:hypothetical protein